MGLGRLGFVKVVIHDRTEELPARLRTYAEQKLERLSRHFDGVLDAQVEFLREAPGLETAEITVHLAGRPHAVARAREQAQDQRAALDLALDKVDRQVVKLKEKIKVVGKRKAAEPEDGQGEAGAEWDGVPERLPLRLHPEAAEDVAAGLDPRPGCFRVFLDEDSGSVNVAYRRSNGRVAVIEPVLPG